MSDNQIDSKHNLEGNNTKKAEAIKKQSSQEIAEEQSRNKKLAELLKEELTKNSKSFFLSRAFVHKPFIVLAICSAVFLVCTIITIVGDLLAMSETSDRDYLLWDNQRTKDFDTFVQMQAQYLESQSDSQIPIRSVENNDWTTSLILKCDTCSNVLKAEYFKKLYEAEQKILNHKDYKKFCLASTSSSDCTASAFRSITSFFSNPAKVTQSEIDTKILEIMEDDDLWSEWKGEFGNELSLTNRKTKILRSVFKFGAPLEIDGIKFRDIYDRETKQKNYFEEFSQEIIDIARDKVSIPDEILLLSFSEIIEELEFQRVVDTDFLFAIGSIIFVLIYISIHLRSFFLGSMAMLSILFSFPVTLTLYSYILFIDYFSSLHILVVFIVLGIAADNVFVFTDAWNQSRGYEQLEGDLEKRMAVTFRRASRAMLATSSTTAAAFFSTGLSPIMPIASFGLFAGVLIPVNYLMVIFFYPAILIVYEKHTKQMCVCKNKQQQVHRKSQDNEDVEKQVEKQEEKKEEGGHMVERFFDNQFNTFTLKFRYPIIIFFAIWTAIAIWRTTKFPALSEPEQFLPDEFDTQQAKSAVRSGVHQSGNSDSGIKVYQYWGTNGLDQEGLSKWDSFEIGTVKWDKDFNLAPQKNQEYFYKLCEDMRDHNLVQDGLVSSFIFSFADFVNNKGVGFPTPEDEFFDELKLYIQTDIGKAYYNSNQIGIIDDRLHFIWIQLAAKGKPFAPYKESNPIFEKWDDYIDLVKKEAPKGLKNSKQTAILHWVFMITEKAFVTSAIQGMAISLVFAFVVLMMTTHNIIMSSYSVLTIAGIVVSVTSIMEMMGWELGVAESITLVILIGLSVDYVVHLANHYVESLYFKRSEKMRTSLRDLGISIVAGASTTLGSGLFLFFATLIVFNKFALLIFATILFSLIYALIFFSALVHSVGPEGEMGNLLMLCKKKNSEKNGSEKKVEEQQNKQLEVQQQQINQGSDYKLKSEDKTEEKEFSKHASVQNIENNNINEINAKQQQNDQEKQPEKQGTQQQWDQVAELDPVPQDDNNQVHKEHIQ